MTKRCGPIKLRLKYKIYLVTSLLILLPIFIIGIFSYNSTSDIIKDKASMDNLATVKQTGAQIDFIFNDIKNVSLFLIQSEIIRDFFLLENTEANSSIIAQRQVDVENYLIHIINSKEVVNSQSIVNSIYFKGFNGVELSTGFCHKKS